MQSRFGLKDFVLLVMVLLVGVSVWLGIHQANRDGARLQEVKTKVAELEVYLSRLEAKLESGAVSVPARAASAPAGAPAGNSSQPAARDDSWARPGIPIAWQQPWTFVTDPRTQPGFAPGGEFTEIFEAQPDKITPFIQTDVYGRRIVDQVLQALAAYDPATLQLRGVLADAWQYDPAGLWLRVHIDPRARFSDGEPVKAEDVRWTFHDYIMNRQIEAERDRSIIDPIKKVTVLSDRAVEFEFNEPFYSNVDLALTMFILPKHFYGRFEPAEINKSTGLLMGSGPYKLENLDPNHQWVKPEPVVLVRNEQYWGGWKPPLARLRFKAIDNSLARLTEYKNGLADMVTPSSPQFVSSLEDSSWEKENRNLKWVNMRSGRAGIIWNCDQRNGVATPFGDKRVRQAMTLLLDREKMIRDIWKGVGQVCKGFANPGTLGDDPDRKPWPYDPPRGLALLKEAGWEDRNGDRVLEDKDGREFTFELTVFGADEITEKLAAFVKDAYAAAGIRVTVRRMDWAVGDPVRQQRDFDAMIMGWGANAPESDPKQIFHSASIANQGDNFAQWSSPEADRAIDQARRELDPEKRARLWRQFEAVLHDEQPYTWIRVVPWIRFIKKGIQNTNMYPKGLEYWEFFRGGAAAPVSGS